MYNICWCHFIFVSLECDKKGENRMLNNLTRPISNVLIIGMVRSRSELVSDHDLVTEPNSLAIRRSWCRMVDLTAAIWPSWSATVESSSDNWACSGSIHDSVTLRTNKRTTFLSRRIRHNNRRHIITLRFTGYKTHRQKFWESLSSRESNSWSLERIVTWNRTFSRTWGAG